MRAGDVRQDWAGFKMSRVQWSGNRSGTALPVPTAFGAMKFSGFTVACWCPLQRVLSNFYPKIMLAFLLYSFHFLFCWLEYHKTGAKLFHIDVSRPYEPNTGTYQLLLETKGCCFQFQPLLWAHSFKEQPFPWKRGRCKFIALDSSSWCQWACNPAW